MKKTISFILIVENILGFYRNYLFFGNMRKNMIILRTVLEMALIIASLTLQEIIKFDLETWHYYTTKICSLFLMFLTLYHSKNFKKLLIYFKTYMSYFPVQSDQVYFRRIDRMNNVLLFVYIFYLSFKLSTQIFYYISFGKEIVSEHIPVFVYCIFEAHLVICYLRLVSEFPVIYCFIFLIAENIDCITRSVEETNQEATQSKVDRKFCNKISLDLFDKWSAAYATLRKISKLWNAIFGLQIAVQITIIIMFYIILTYNISSLSVEGEIAPTMWFFYCISMAEYLIAIYLVSKSAQRVQNSVNALRQRLSTLLIHSIGYETQYKATRHLLRLVSNHPIEMKAFGSITADMTLLPTCIGFCTAYIVIVLQFSNIL